MPRNARLLVLLTFVLSGCNLRFGAPQAVDPAVALTAAALTVQALMPATLPPAPPLPTVPPAPSPTPVPPNTFAPPASPTSNCNVGNFMADITIPDDSILAPNQNFTKTWRVKNNGTCTWTPAYAVVFSTGNSMNGPAAQALTGNINPGQTLDVSVNLTAPGSTGDYRGDWKLRDASGVLFSGFYVKIRVQTPSSSGYDFHTRAASASWIGSAGAITFGGPDTDPDGFALYRDGQLLEDGSSPAKVLEIHPQWVDNGVMTGIFGPYSVVSGDHFLSKIGFRAFADGSCGAGNAKFQLSQSATGSPPWSALGTWSEVCDGSLNSVDVSLEALAGQSRYFALAVLANGTSTQDWGVWVKPRIAGP